MCQAWMVLALFSTVHTYTFLELNIPMVDAAKFYLHWHWHIALKQILLWQILTEVEEYRTDWIPNFSGTELFGYKNYRIRYQTYQISKFGQQWACRIPNWPDSELIGYWTYWILNLFYQPLNFSDTEHSRYWTHRILKLLDTEVVGYWSSWILN